jgi:PKD repeat protein
MFYYTVPTVNSSQCKMKIHRRNNTQYQDTSAVFSISTNPTLPKVLMQYPNNANLHFAVGQSLSLSWSRHNVQEVALDLSTDNGDTWQEIATGLNADTYSWVVSDYPGLNCRLRVRAMNNPAVSDISDNSFSISKVELLSDLSGGLFTADYSNGYSLPIAWSAPGMANVKLEYSANGGQSWSSISNSFNAAVGAYNWPLPGTPGTNYRIRVSNALSSAINDVSGIFSLRNPVRILNANGGGFVTNGSLFNLRWLNQDVDPAWQVFWEYSLNNSSWTRIYTNSSPVSNQNLNWFVTSGLSNTVWLRALRADNNRIIAKSEASFRVTDKSLILWAPNGGEDYPALSTQTIFWEAQGCTNLILELSTDNGLSWSNIAGDIPSTQGSYQWLVPDSPSQECRVRIRDASHTYMNLISDLAFTISPLEIVDPTVDFSADILYGEIPLAVQFTEAVDPGVGTIAGRLWDFGDGNTSEAQNPLHTYTLPGIYSVSLTINNSFGGSSSESKEDYIEVLPNRPQITLLSNASLNYGIVYLGDTSPAQMVEVKNSGSAPLSISDIGFHHDPSAFSPAENPLPQVLAVNATLQLALHFCPSQSGSVSDSLYIYSDAVNAPTLVIALRGTGEYVPPETVDAVSVTISGYDAHISWEEVTQTIYGSPITPDCYIVLYNETPYEDEQFYYYLTFTDALSAVHSGVARFRGEMFYRIVAVKFERGMEEHVLSSLGRREQALRWGELREMLKGNIRNQ